MKIFDCFMYMNEDVVLDLRLNYLNNFVDKFIIVESLFFHSGKKKKLNFDIKNYLKFKDKIIYLIIDKEPKDLIVNSPNIKQNEKRINSLKRIDLSYNHMISGISGATEDDLIILSDNDEIPNLNSDMFKKTKKNIIIFKQLFFYYKFNLLYDRVPWFGSKACKKKYLKSFSWLKQIKNKKYPFWRFDTYFKSLKNINLQIVENGGWHFTNVNTPKEVFEKMKNFGHHDEFDASGLTVDDIEKKIINKKVFYNHLARQEANNKWNSEYELKKIDGNMLPKYLLDNRENFKEWFQ